MRSSQSKESGIALVSAVFVTFSLVAVCGMYLGVSYTEYESGLRETATVRARCAAEEALHLSVAELKGSLDSGGDGLGTLSTVGADGRRLSAVVTSLGGDLYRVHAEGAVTRASLAYDALVQVIPAPAVPVNARAAVTAEGSVSTLGNIRIDGRDWNEAGTSIVGPGVFGISSMSTIVSSGSSTIGGNGFAPSILPNPLAIQPLALWRDLVDNDGDGRLDEEQWNGVDDDGDGEIDEDTNDYPENPDLMLNLPTGSLKAVAQAQGTYFATQAAYEAFRTANGGNLPGGKVYYLEFNQWQPANLSSTMNATPSILVHHNSAGNAQMKNVHHAFKGLVMADLVQHINGDFLLVGAFMSFSNKAYGNTYGNGNATIKYSSAVLGSLPSANPARQARLLSIQRSAVD